jgi:hypothetical protein
MSVIGEEIFLIGAIALDPIGTIAPFIPSAQKATQIRDAFINSFFIFISHFLINKNQTIIAWAMMKN